ncbi:MAG: alpha-mannosidase [Thermoproteales archaeon]|nr:alpha-mannosidase [Thermoproteales archaeon]
MHKDEKIRLVGHAHIDLAWLWTKDETIHLVSKGTFNYALWLMDQYPNLVFAQSSAQLYKWMKEYYPSIYEKIKEKVKSGNWEIVGGSWSEHNANILSGETLIRQYYYGKKFFEKEFGVDVELAWLPDCFGFNWGMPQILRKAGIKYFITSKLNWQINRMEKPIPFPYFLFIWEGIDGSRILSHLTPGGYNQNVNPRHLLLELEALKQKHGINYLLVLFGHGDHGGGPNRDMIERAISLGRWEKFPRIEFGKAINYFKEIEERYSDELPIYRDELYLKTHRGTFTTEARIKKFLRRTEVALTNLEKLSTLAYLLGFRNLQERIDEAWKGLLFITTHDIMDGTSIEQVYIDLYNDEIPFISKTINDLTENVLEYIIDKISLEDGEEHVNIVIFNTLSWSRDGEVLIDRDQIPFDTFIIQDPSGEEVPYQFDETGKKILFVAKDIPGLGYAVYKVKSSREKHDYSSELKIGEWFLENRYLRVEIDPDKGIIRRLYDKVNEKDVFDPIKGGNILEVYEDMPPNAPSGEPAWNIYLGNKEIISKVENIEIVEKGPIRGVIRIKLSYGQTKITEDIVLYTESKKVDLKLRVYWLEKYKFLKAAFPLSFRNDYATYEIPFGVIQRFRHDLKGSDIELEYPKRKWEEADIAKFEVPALRWAEINTRSKNYSVTFLNDSKYGFSYGEDTFRISLLRGPRRGGRGQPDSWADLSSDPLVGEHEIRYSIYPHEGVWKDAKVTHQGYEYNTPLIVRIVNKSVAGDLPQRYSFVRVDNPDVIVTTVKLSDSNVPVIRIYEPYDKNENVIISLFKDIKKAWKTDILEKDKYVYEELLVRNNEIITIVSRFEIATIKISI